MPKRVLSAKVEFYNPTSGALRYTVTDDIRLVSIEENGRDEADDGRIELANPGGAHTGQFNEGDEVRVHIQTQDDAALVHIWTGIVDNVRSERHGDSYADLIVEAQDYVYARLATSYVTDVFENQKAGAIIRSFVQNANLGIDVTNVEDTTKTIASLNFNGTSLLQATRKVAELGRGEFRGDKDKKLHYFEKGTKSSGAVVTPAYVTRGTFRVETSMAGVGNVIKVRGGHRATQDQANETFSSFATLTGATRKTARVYVSKASVAQVDLYTGPDASNVADLRLRIQADNEAGDAPIEVGNPDRDLVGRTLPEAFLTEAGWTSILLPVNSVAPGSYVWLIAEAATDGESQRVGVDASGGLLYRTFYPVPVIVERIDQTSIDLYGSRELPPINDKNIASEDEANLLADETLARSSTPQKTAEYEVQDFSVQKEATTNVVPDGDFSTQTLQNPYSSALNGTLSFVDDSSPDVGGKALKQTNTSGTTESYTQKHQGAGARLANAAPGETWTASVYVKAASPSDVGAIVELFVFGLDASDNYFSGSHSNSGLVTLTDSWQRVTVSKTFPSGVEGVGTRVDVNTPGKAAIWSGWQVEKKSSATPFVDGSRGDISLPGATLGETVSASFPSDDIAAGSAYILMRRTHIYDAEAQSYSLRHEIADAERILRVEDILLRIHERIRRNEDGLMGRSTGEIADLIRTFADTFGFTGVWAVTEYASNSFVVGTAEVGFSTVA